MLRWAPSHSEPRRQSRGKEGVSKGIGGDSALLVLWNNLSVVLSTVLLAG